MFENETETATETNKQLQPVALVIGLAVAAIGLSGLLDDSDVLNHPYWVVPMVCIFVACAAVAARTVQKVLKPEG